MIDAFFVLVAVVFVVGAIALTIDTIVHDDFPDLYDDELP